MLKDLELKGGHLVLLALAALIGVTAGHFLFPSGSITGSSVSSSNGSAEEVVSLMNKASPVNATLKNVEEFHGLYRIIVKARGREMPLYMTEDGEYLFSGATKISSLRQRLNSNQSQSSQQQQEEFDAPDKDKPTVELFVQAFCPYGGQSENAMKPVYALLGDKINWEPHYIVSEQNGEIKSLHGSKEVEQDKRELCILEEYGVDTWFDFVTYVNKNCGSSGSCWQAAANTSEIDVNSIKTCVKKRGTSLLKEEAQIIQKRGIRASPTLIINGEKKPTIRGTLTINGEDFELKEQRSPKAYKEAICSGFKSEPEVCNTELGNTNSSSTGGQC